MEFTTVLDIAVGIATLFLVVDRKVNLGRKYRQARYGSFFGNLWYWMGILDTGTIQRFHWNINNWTNQEALNWRDSYVANCSAVAVAAAIFASIGQAAWSLPNLTDTHWSARALLSASMALGILSVSLATLLQRAVLRLSTHLDIRLWLSRGFARQDHYRNAGPFGGLPLESSAFQLKLSESPSLILGVAVFMYLVGFGLYLLYGWLWEVESARPNDFRNIFIFYVCVIGAAVFYILGLLSKQVFDQDKRNRDFDLAMQLDTGEKPDGIIRLDRWFQLVETLKNMDKSEEERQKALDDLSALKENFASSWSIEDAIDRAKREKKSDGQGPETDMASQRPSVSV